MCKRAVEYNPWYLIHVPEHLKTKEMCEKAVSIGPWLLEHAPDNLRDQEMCKKAFGENTNMLKYVPYQYITQELCARGCPWLIDHVPDDFKTQEMCTKTLELCPWSLEYIPDWFVTKEQIKLWHDDRLLKWYEGYQKRKAQKTSRKEGLMPIAWHPSRYWDWCMSEDEKIETEKLFLTT